MFFRKPSWKDGTTAINVLAINNTLYIANIGDSKVSARNFQFILVVSNHFKVFYVNDLGMYMHSFASTPIVCMHMF